MLSPDYRLLDPEEDQIEKLSELSPYQLTDKIAIDQSRWEELEEALRLALNKPGVVSQKERLEQCYTQASEVKTVVAEHTFYKWPASLLKRLIDERKGHQVLVLGILDGEGIWAGCLCGVRDGQIDFLTTFNWLWQDDPELASKQTMEDVHELCQAASKCFGRKSEGLFIYLDEFKKWRDEQWPVELLEKYKTEKTAIVISA